MKYVRLFAVCVFFLAVSGFTECYKPVTNSGLPKNIKTIAVPAFQFEAKGLRYRVRIAFYKCCHERDYQGAATV